MEKIILYFGQNAKVVCDEKCSKAWGINNRPRVYLSDPETDPDDYYFLADDELPIAPVNPGTYEGGDAKPTSLEQVPNRWCVRECERCAMSSPGKYNEPLELRDLSIRIFNKKALNSKE